MQAWTVRRVAVASAWPTVVAVGAMAAVLARGKPTIASDAGVFLTMFDAASNGDRLYVDAFDHKDPLFYWLGALEYQLLGIRGVFIAEVLWVGFFAVIAMRYAQRRGLSEFSSALVAALSVGFLTQTALFRAGLTTVPAVALLAGAALAAASGRFRLAGVASAMVLLVKLAFAPLLLPIAAMVFATRRREDMRRYAGGALAVGALATLRLITHGELGGYFAMIGFNVDYANEVLPQDQARDGIFFNLLRLQDFLAANLRPLLGVVLLLIALVITVLPRSLFGGDDDDDDDDDGDRRGEFYAIGTTALTLIFLAGTYLWQHHLGVLAWPLALVSIEATRRLRNLGIHRVIAVVAAVLVVVLVADLGRSDTTALADVGSRWAAPQSFIAPRVEQILLDSAPTEEIRLAISSNHYQAVMPFFDDRIELACPDFYQLPWFADRIDNHLTCIATKATHVLQMHEVQIAGYNQPLADLLARDFEPPVTFIAGNGQEIRVYAHK